MCIADDVFVVDAFGPCTALCVVFVLFPLHSSERVLFHSHGFEEMPSFKAFSSSKGGFSEKRPGVCISLNTLAESVEARGDLRGAPVESRG